MGLMADKWGGSGNTSLPRSFLGSNLKGYEKDGTLESLKGSRRTNEGRGLFLLKMRPRGLLWVLIYSRTETGESRWVFCFSYRESEKGGPGA